MRHRFVLALILLICTASLSTANPGGEGDSIQSQQCGGSCHGDAGQNVTSAAVVSVVAQQQVWAGLLTTVDVVVENPQLSNQRMLGVFLLINDRGAKDTPAHEGWEIVADPNGGANNYVEKSVARSAANITFTWTLRAPVAGNYELLASIHHGGTSQPEHGNSPTISLSVVEPPENLPRLSSDFTPPSTRSLGEETTIELVTDDVDSFFIEWRTEGGAPQSLNGSEGEFTLPAAVNAGKIEWRAHLNGEGPTQPTPWFALISQEPAWQVEEPALFLQGMAMMLLFAGLIMLQRPSGGSGGEKIPIAVDATALVEATHFATSQLPPPLAQAPIPTTSQLPPPLASAPATLPQLIPTPAPMPTIPLEGIPTGWSLEQWRHYGQGYLDKNKEGGLQ